MIITLLVIILALLVVYIHYFFNKELLSPSLVSVTAYFAASFILLLNKEVWGVELHFNTVIHIIGSVLLMAVGEVLVRMYYQNNCGLNPRKVKHITETLYVKNKVCIILFILLLLALIPQIKLILSIYDEYKDVKYIGRGFSIMGTYRKALGNELVDKGSIITLIEIVSHSIATFFMFVFFSQLIYKKQKNIYLLLPVLGWFPHVILSSGRIMFLYFMCYSLVLFYMMTQINSRWSKTNNAKFVKNTIIALICFLIFFSLLGILLNKGGDSILSHASLYMSSSIPAFDVFLQNFEYDSINFGDKTLFGVGNLLARFGIEGIADGNRNMEFVVFGRSMMRTNIYTSISRILYDYGYWGYVLYPMMLSFIYVTIYSKLKYALYRRNTLPLLFFALFFFAIPMQVIDEAFLKGIIGISTVLKVFLITFFYKLSRKEYN